MDISDIDVNFRPKGIPQNIELSYYNIDDEPFKIFGVMKEDAKYRRIPEKIAKSVSQCVFDLNTNTAGGRVCFKTNSQYIAISAKMPYIAKLGHFTTVGSAGFDLYVRDEFRAVFVPEYGFADGFSSYADLNDKSIKEITINFPTYSDVSELYIGVEKDSLIEEYNPYIDIPPIVYYGSSITQGGCASHPGNTYQSEIARRTSIDYINLGFSGNAKGEPEMAQYIAGLDMSIFVMDYDHNAPSPEHLNATHEAMYKTIREKSETIPIIFISKPDFSGLEHEIQRRNIIHSTYIKAYESGDRNVHFIDGSTFFGGVSRSFCTVDKCHPNDLGFYCMANNICKVIEDIIRYG